MNLLLNAANVLYICAYFVRNILYLRVLSVIAALSLSLYFYSLPEPLMVAVRWNLFFVAVNLVQIGRLLLERRTRSGPARMSRPSLVV